MIDNVNYNNILWQQEFRHLLPKSRRRFILPSSRHLLSPFYVIIVKPAFSSQLPRGQAVARGQRLLPQRTLLCVGTRSRRLLTVHGSFMLLGQKLFFIRITVLHTESCYRRCGASGNHLWPDCSVLPVVAGTWHICLCCERLAIFCADFSTWRSATFRSWLDTEAWLWEGWISNQV